MAAVVAGTVVAAGMAAADSMVAGTGNAPIAQILPGWQMTNDE